MAIEYGVFVAEGLHVSQQTPNLTAQGTGFTNVEGFETTNEHLVSALSRVGNEGWTLVTVYPDTINQTSLFIFSRPGG